MCVLLQGVYCIVYYWMQFDVINVLVDVGFWLIICVLHTVLCLPKVGCYIFKSFRAYATCSVMTSNPPFIVKAGLQTMGCRKLCICSLVSNSISLLEGIISTMWPSGCVPWNCALVTWKNALDTWDFWH